MFHSIRSLFASRTRTPRPAATRARLGQEGLALDGRLVPTVFASYSVVDDHASWFESKVTLSNDGPQAVPFDSLRFTLPSNITSIWDAQTTGRYRDFYYVTNGGWNKSIPAGGAVSFGFTANTGRSGTASEFLLNGVSVTENPAKYQLSFERTQDWGGSMLGKITIRNTGSNTLTNWRLTFDLPGSIHSMWNGVQLGRSGNRIEVGPTSYNASIPAGGKVEVGFEAIPGGLTATNLSLSATAVAPPANRVPVAGADTATVTAGQTVQIAVLANDTDPDGDALSVTAVGGPAHGSAAVSGGGVKYTPAAGYTGTDSFTYTASDGKGGTATGSVTVTVTAGPIAPTNRAPAAAADLATVVSGQPVRVDVLMNDSDPDKDALSVTSVTAPAHGTAVVNAAKGTVTYTAKAGYGGSDSFTYTVSDGKGGTATGTVSVGVTAASAPAAANPAAWPAHVFAPYVDVSQPDHSEQFFDFAAASKSSASGTKYFSLGFVVADSQDRPTWGGYDSYKIGTDWFSDEKIRDKITALRAAGGDVTVSFGGASGKELATVITDQAALTAAYRAVIQAYNLTHIDFDIEGDETTADAAANARRAKAIVALQQEFPGLRVSFTLATTTTGLEQAGKDIVKGAKDAGVKIGLVNLMTMDYGTGNVAPGQMAAAAISSATGLFNYLDTLYGSSLTTAQKWGMVGLTPMIGQNDTLDEVFGLQNARDLKAWAANPQHHIGQLAMWSINRDRYDVNYPSGVQKLGKPGVADVDGSSSGIAQADYEFCGIFNPFVG